MKKKVKKNDIGPQHVHGREVCGRCDSMYMDGWRDVCKTERAPQVIIEKTPTWNIHVTWFFISVIAALAGFSYGYPNWFK